jgi:hypothetical protein
MHSVSASYMLSGKQGDVIMPKSAPEVTSIEYGLKGKGPKFETWVTVKWGTDDEMQVYIGKKDPHKLDLDALPKEAEDALHRIAQDLAKTKVSPLRGDPT